jgi:N-acetylmuramoyl-L-alanine amidase
LFATLLALDFRFTFHRFPAQCARMKEIEILAHTRTALTLLCAAVLTSCSSNTDFTLMSAASSSPATTNPAPLKPVAPPQHAPAITNKQPLTPIAKEPEPIRGWVDINRWARANGIGNVRTVSGGAQPRFDLAASSGRLDFAIGNHIAHWNGLAFMLGFAPQMIGREPSVNGLDLQKSFLPLLQPTASPRARIIVIDPGHGGPQVGTRSVTGKHFEKEFTLDWALRLQSLLARQGLQVYLTRTNDIDLPLQDRVAVADRVNADLFLSLHFNSGTTSGAESGIETYCTTPFGMPSNLTRGYVDDPEYNWPNNASDRENFSWAMRLHRSLINTTGATDRGVRRARFMAVLRTQRRPAVLLEGGYLSNPREARLIGTAEYRQQLAQAVANAFGQQSGAREQSISNPAVSTTP